MLECRSDWVGFAGGAIVYEANGWVENAARLEGAGWYVCNGKYAIGRSKEAIREWRMFEIIK